MLEPYAVKVACTVLRGRGASNGLLLPDPLGNAEHCMSTPKEIDLGQLDQAAEGVIQRICAYLQDDQGVHIETAIAAAGSLAGVAILRSTGLPLPISELGKVQVVLAEEVNEWGSALIQFMSSVCPTLGLDATFTTTEVPPEHQPNKNMIEGVLEWVRDLESPCNQVLDELQIDHALRPHTYAFIALKLVKAGEQMLPPPVGKALALSAIVAGSKTAPYGRTEA
jgi:hypothetical protein